MRQPKHRSGMSLRVENLSENPPDPRNTRLFILVAAFLAYELLGGKDLGALGTFLHSSLAQ